MYRSSLHKKFVRDAGLVGRGGSSADRRLLGGTTPKPAAEPRDCPSLPTSNPPKGLEFGLVLGRGLGSDWFEQTCKVEVDDTCPAQSFAQAAPAHSGRPSSPGRPHRLFFWEGQGGGGKVCRSYTPLCAHTHGLRRHQ